jgi:hypothetical protein
VAQGHGEVPSRMPWHENTRGQAASVVGRIWFLPAIVRRTPHRDSSAGVFIGPRVADSLVVHPRSPEQGQRDILGLMKEETECKGFRVCAILNEGR